MKAGKSTETIGNRLDALTPGPAFDNAAAWNKLQQRLEKKKTRILFPWKWAAAAAAVLFVAWLLIPGKKADNITNQLPEKPVQTEMQSRTAHPAAPAPAVAISPATKTRHNPDKAATINKDADNPGPIPDSTQNALISHTPDESMVKTATIPPEETIPVPVTMKKLPVVYNNDLARAEPEELLPAGEETTGTDPLSLLRKLKYHNSIKGDQLQPAEPPARRKKGTLPFGISFNTKE